MAPQLGTLAVPFPGSPGNGAAPAPGTPIEPASGSETDAKISVARALDLLNHALSKLKPGSKEHSVVMECTKRLSKEFAPSAATEALAKTADAQSAPPPDMSQPNSAAV